MRPLIRDYRPADFDTALYLIQRAVREIASRDYSPEQTAAWMPADIDRHAWAQRLSQGSTFVAEADGAIAGLTRVEARGYVDLLFVHPDAQRRGVGLALLEHVLSWAAEKGIVELVSDVSLTARNTFERAGFALQQVQEVERNGVRLSNFRMARHIGESNAPTRHFMHK